MSIKLRSSSLIILIILMCNLLPKIVYGQRAHNRQYVLVGWECSKTIDLTRLGFDKLLGHTRNGRNHSESHFDRAVLLDLNGDGIKEYVVPFECGGTGNCNWGVFTSSPKAFLGAIAGQYLYIERTRGRWPEIKTYTHMGAVDGMLATYRYKKGAYQWLKDEEEVSIFLQNLPMELATAKAVCKLEWNPNYLNKGRQK